MTAEAVKKVIVEALARIAPEIEPSAIRADAGLREQLDLDSIDFLNLMLALHERLGVEIPEADYGHFATLDSAAAYLAPKTS
ncbi:MAG: acyl carrier protein [Acidobacteria bacterium]|nr:MAG: acyl carrier protein [Acidobacteriota bacterium]